MTAEAMRTLSPRTAGEADLALGAESAADWIPLGRIAEHLPRGPGGKRTNRSTIWRWITRGCGGVRLATILVGRRRWTTRQAVREFVAATTAAGEPEMTVAEVREARRAQRANLAYLRRHGFSVAETGERTWMVRDNGGAEILIDDAGRLRRVTRKIGPPLDV